ncbi:hypothetical protein RB195_015535 [Necator americanus]|uniref:Reverse transcriptase domain-containing protein n=1 Tax=Necator americanus TaxID=51031 RepID=A0ABR1E5N2_NECAM
MRELEWDDMGLKLDGRYLRHLRFADDIVLIITRINQAERMLAEFDETCGRIGLRLTLDKTRNGWVFDASFMLNGTNMSECSSYAYLGLEISVMKDLNSKLSIRKRIAWGAFKSIENVVKRTKNIRLRAHPFNTTLLPALTYASETSAFCEEEKNTISVIEHVIDG